MAVCPYCNTYRPTPSGMRTHIKQAPNCARLDRLALFELMQRSRPFNFDDPEMGADQDDEPPPGSPPDVAMDVDGEALNDDK
ncbi:hypothetical protein SISSUDRAFT_422076 [Sistotremastrum suecicum HHB10207 ss-3]|uniref:Uncharacterized protein n=1 Tax=Sistotremastrum suecicum HHB10207 ss-3 TaxID=1314776 RepID=A0A165YKK0_9AGAM|nr:hypothetical protein SISSUDRAFT_422076 [Sistotremastrum suecicum HHB10207 ss-3]